MPPPRTVYAVSELLDLLRGLIEDSLPRIWVQGEISNFSRPASGHWYFSLKDERGALRCAMFKNVNFLVRPQPRDGDAVLVRGRIDIYGARGELQLICEYLEPAGEGALLRAFEELKKRLAAEGLFDTALKRPLPVLPRAIGLITSATGAAIQDVLAALSRRFPLVQVFLHPVPVQGREAAPAIVRALAALPRMAPIDLVLLVRGGGSLEDLWAFNDEALARAIRACAVPVVTGVGHEVDFTIADFAADLRAPTPTAAAELVSPDGAQWLARIAECERTLRNCSHRGLAQRHERLERMHRRLASLHPQRELQRRAQGIDECEQTMLRTLRRILASAAQRCERTRLRLQAQAPLRRLGLDRLNLSALERRLRQSPLQGLAHLRQSLRRTEGLLHAVSPQAVLERGYAIARRADGAVLRDAAQVQTDEALELVLARGKLGVRVVR